jgi:alcohol dehydrogenase (cytochrome c)
MSFKRYAPTDASLVNPSADDWLIWQRTYENLGHSPPHSNQPIQRFRSRNSLDLSRAIGANIMTPLLHDGVLFVYSNGDVVQAFDGAKEIYCRVIKENRITAHNQAQKKA